MADTIRVPGLKQGDIVKVYSAAGENKIGSAQAIAKAGTPVTYEALVSIPQLDPNGTNVYVTVTSTIPANKLESERVAVSYTKAPQSTKPVDTNITITNNAGIPDTVKVTGLAAGDIVKVYSAATGGLAIGSAMALAKSGATITYEALVSVIQLGNTGSTAYVTVTSPSKLESDRAGQTYIDEKVTPKPLVGDINITNNAGLADTTKVTGLKDGDLVKVYKDNTISTTLGVGQTRAIVGTPVTYAVINIFQIGTGAVPLYVTVTNRGSAESQRLLITSDIEAQSSAPIANNILIINNIGTDLIVAYGLTAGDAVKVYSTKTGNPLLTNTVVPSGQTYVVILIKQLGINAGSVNISITGMGKTESTKTNIPFLQQ
jgi:hypothetical protein